MKRRVRLLHADGHDLLLRGVEAMLADRPSLRLMGSCKSGRQALSLISTIKPDVAILDFALPDLNAVEVISALSRLSPKTAVLIYTESGSQQVVSAALSAGARGFVLKSDPADCLLAAIDALASGRSYFAPAIAEIVLERVLYPETSQRTGRLTRQEKEVVRYVALGQLNRQIAAHLKLSVKTVETHRSQAMQKLRTPTTTDLVRWAIRNNLVTA